MMDETTMDEIRPKQYCFGFWTVDGSPLLFDDWTASRELTALAMADSMEEYPNVEHFIAVRTTTIYDPTTEGEPDGS